VAAPNAFTGAELDRAADFRRRDPRWVAAQRDHPHARALVAGSAGLRARDGRLEFVELAAAPSAGPVEPVLLGLDRAGPLWAVDEDPAPADGRPGMIGAGGRRGEPPPPARHGERMGLREAAAALRQAEGGLAAYAAALLNWHRRHRFCANCGQPSESVEGGLARRCPACGADHHPRTDPVVIMLVSDGDRVLLGRQPIWPEGRYSALAGFVGPGESLEEAVRREVGEEAGVRIGPPVYHSSQPWPFPASLMLGFSAPWVGGEPGGTDDELQDVRWFSRPTVVAAARVDRDDWSASSAGDELLLPPRVAIARRLIDTWLAAPGLASAGRAGGDRHGAASGP
jgi:NAD+ diphosphatase